MLNILGEADGDEGAAAAKTLLDKAYTVPGDSTHNPDTCFQTFLKCRLQQKEVHCDDQLSPSLAIN